ncbi:MAG: nucleotidyltransferase domain-containing protein [Candidatus Micrarchaeota archaeon]
MVLIGLGLVAKRGRQELLKTLLEFPNREFTINELAKTAGVPFASAWRAVREWEQAGFIETRLVGRARLVRLRNKDYAARLLQASGFPSTQNAALEAVRKELEKEVGVKRAFVFGSVAEGKETPSSDVDLALLVSKRVDAYGLISRVFDATGCRLVPLQFSSARKFADFVSLKRGVNLFG